MTPRLLSVLLPALLAFGLAACGGKTDAPAATASSDVAAEAVRDVDAAMAEAQAKPRAPPAVSAN